MYNEVGINSDNNVFKFSSMRCRIGSESSSNTLGSAAVNCTIGNQSWNNVIITAQNAKIGNNSNNNNIDNGANDAEIGNNSNNNNIGPGSGNNIKLRNFCNANIFGTGAQNLSLDDNSESNTLLNTSGKIGKNCVGNDTGLSGQVNLVLEDWCTNNVFTDGGDSNTLMQHCSGNTFITGASHNTLEPYCVNNHITGNDNYFHANCTGNNFGFGMEKNIFGPNITGNTAQAGFKYNRLLNLTNGNVFGQNAQYNTLINSSNNTIGDSVKNCILVDKNAQVLADNEQFNYPWAGGAATFVGLIGQPTDNVALGAALDLKVDKIDGYDLSQNNFSTSEKDKLATLSEHFKGKYLNEADLNTANPTGNLGDYAYIDVGIGNDSKMYIWDNDDSVWVLSSGGGIIPDATESISGIIEIATIAEALARTDDQRAMTALKTVSLILDEKKNVNYQIQPISVNEVFVLMENAGSVNSVLVSGASNVKLKIGSAGTYPVGAQTYPFVYAANDVVYVTYIYSNLADARCVLKLKCKDN
jgi:hypothetical protein